MKSKWESIQSLKNRDTNILIVKRLLRRGSIRKWALASGWNGSGWRGENMNFEKQQAEMVILNHISKNELAKVVVELIKNDREVQRAILNLAFSCPNIVTQI